MTTRRRLIGNLAALGGVAATGGCRSWFGGPAFPAYGARLSDRLWMWGHDSGVYDGPKGEYGIPLSPAISMADACADMGIPNVCVIRWEKADAAYLAQFRRMRRVSWVIGSVHRKAYQNLREHDFDLIGKMPNLVGFDLDDLFLGGAARQVKTPEGERLVLPTDPTYEQIQELSARAKAAARPMDLRAVLYTHQLKPEIAPLLNYMDTVTFWTWSGVDVAKLEQNFRTYRKFVPKTPTLLGIYMWDFGGRKPLDMTFMRAQMDVAEKLFKAGDIEGLVFHCTPLVNKGLEAVNYCRDWIARHRDDTRS